MFSLFGLGGLGSFGGIFMVVAIIDWIRRRPDTFWLFVIIFLGPIGSLVYIFAEMVPSIRANQGKFSWLERHQRISRLELETRENPSPGNWEELGMLYLDNKEYARAKRAYDQALAQRTDLTDAFYRRAICEVRLGDFKGAFEDLQRVVTKESDYDFGRAFGLLAHSLANLGDTERADIAFREAFKVDSSSEFMVHYAEYLQSSGRKAEAKEMARRVLEKKPLMPPYQRRREREWLRKAAQIA